VRQIDICRNRHEEDKESMLEEDQNFLELNKHQKANITANFNFYVRNKGGSVNLIERFELPMVLEGRQLNA
jgi:hypothetical protein